MRPSPAGNRSNHFLALSLATVLAALPVNAVADGLASVSYANDAAALEVGSRLAGCAGVALGLPGDPSHLGRSPAGLVDVLHPEVVYNHASLYEDLSLSQDELYVAAPLSGGTLGLGVSRVSADGILRSTDASTQDLNNPSTFSAADWIGTMAFARSWMDGHLRGGASLRFLARDIDQHSGAGAEMDASIVWSHSGWRLGARMDRGLGGFSLWRNGYAEYSAPDMELGIGWQHPFPYFYGTLALALETPGLLQPQASSTFSEGDARPWKHPSLFARASRAALEFTTDFGLVLRTGCEIQALTRVTDFLQGSDQQGIYGESSGLYSFGVGYLWSNRVRIDYALVGTPDLGTSQRISLALVFGASDAPKAAAPAAPERVRPAAAPDPDESKVEPKADQEPAAPVPATAAPSVEKPSPEPVEPKKAPASDEDAPEQIQR